MGSDTTIGQISQFVLKTTNTLGETVETALNKKFIGNSEATYANVDTAMKALASLSTNTYSDTICVTNISVNEVMAG